MTQIPLMIVGNKTDLEDLRKVSFEEGKELVYKLKGVFKKLWLKKIKMLKNLFIS